MARPKAKVPKTRDLASPALGEGVRWRRLAFWGTVVSIIATAGFVRIWAARDEFWMDEIWSLLYFAGIAKSPLDIFTFHHDNNHYLMTSWMYLLGPLQRYWIMYRLPSIAAGIGTVALAGLIARRWGVFAILASLLLTGASYVLIVYASEARGYALAGFFALAAFLALDRYLVTHGVWANLAFIVASLLGTLSHLTFVEFYFAAAAWSLIVCLRSSATWQEAAHYLARLHALPLVFCIALYFIDVRFLTVGGGREDATRDVVIRALALAVGSFGESPAWGLAAALLGAATAIAALVALWRERSDLWVLFAMATFVAPALIVAIRRPTQLYERYFYVNMLFFLVLLSYFAGRAWRFGAAGRASAVLALLLFLWGNARLSYDFLRVGRGHFREAIEYMARHSVQPDFTIGDNGKRTRNFVYAEFYGRYLLGEHRIMFVKLAPDAPIEPEWVIANSQAREFRPPAKVFPLKGRQAYLLEGVFPFAGLSGMHFAIYHRSSDAAGTSPQ